MKKILIGFLALGSISVFASNANRDCVISLSLSGVKADSPILSADEVRELGYSNVVMSHSPADIHIKVEFGSALYSIKLKDKLKYLGGGVYSVSINGINVKDGVCNEKRYKNDHGQLVFNYSNCAKKAVKTILKNLPSASEVCN